MPDYLPSPIAFDALPQAPSRELRNVGDRSLTDAKTDEEAVWEWLRRYADSPRTYEAYHREAERFTLWRKWRGLPLASITVSAMTDYALWLGNPAPLDMWCVVQTPRYLADGSANPAWRMGQRPARRLPDQSVNPAWRPFMGALSPAARSQALVIIHGLFEYLSATGYLAGNPLKVMKTGTRKPRIATIERYLEQDLWQHVRAYLETLPKETARELAHYHRAKFLTAFLYLTGLRLSEISTARTTDLRRDEDGRWWLRVHGKGGSEEDVPLTTECLAVIHEYRVSTGRSAWPDPRVEEPLVMDITGKGKPLSIKAIYQALKVAFLGAAGTCEDPYFAEKLRRASTHWLRHTSATSQLRAGVPLTVVSRNLRHRNLATTQVYLHTERREQAQETEQFRL